MKKKISSVFVLLLLVIFCSVQPSGACVGRSLKIAYMDFSENHILARMLGILIEERTGTKVLLREFGDAMEVQKAMESNEVQIAVIYTGVALLEVLHLEANDDASDVYRAVREAYAENFNFVLLKPFGFNSTHEENEVAISKGVPCEVAPVVRRDTLEKYPALARLINKLNRKMDEEIIDEMVAQVDMGKKLDSVASGFLGKLGISFSFAPG